MDSVLSFLLNNFLVIGLFLVGLVFGRINEKSHLSTLAEDEKILGHVITSTERFHRPQIATHSSGVMVLGSVVIAQDFFKMFVAGILNFLGLNLVTYESLLERARREAIVRMKREAHFQGYNQVYGIRLEVTTLNMAGSMVEAIAYGTAVYAIDNPKIPPPLPSFG